MQYPFNLIPDGSGWLITFPDIPEALTGGQTKEDAIEMAKDALITALEFYFEDKRTVPNPSKQEKGQEVVNLPVSLCAKILLLNEMVAQKIRPTEMARKIGTTAQEFNRITNLRHATKIDSIDQALRALGKRLELHLA